MGPSASPNIAIQPLRAEQIDALIVLARRIWNAHYPGIISQAQIDYMLEQRYTSERITSQLDDPRQHWWVALDLEGRMRGFAHAIAQPDEAELKLDKLYVDPTWQGQGIGRRLLRPVFELARSLGLRRVVLQVNRANHGAIAAYRQFGFVVERALVVDIGGGFVMDDYWMVAEV